MKVIIIEGLDNTGKNSVISQLLEKYNIVKLYHCDKPKSKNNVDAQIEQEQLFYNYANEVLNESPLTDAIIFNRSWYGEYVYGCMYRNANEDRVLNMIDTVETKLDNEYTDVCLITLIYDNTNFILNNDDGLSLSKNNIEKINIEKERFIQIHNHSKLKKKLITVNDGDKFRKKEDIFSEIEQLIKS